MNPRVVGALRGLACLAILVKRTNGLIHWNLGHSLVAVQTIDSEPCENPASLIMNPKQVAIGAPFDAVDSSLGMIATPTPINSKTGELSDSLRALNQTHIRTNILEMRGLRVITDYDLAIS